MSETPQERLRAAIEAVAADVRDIGNVLCRAADVEAVLDLVRVQDEANREMTRLLAEAEAERDALLAEVMDLRHDYAFEIERSCTYGLEAAGNRCDYLNARDEVTKRERAHLATIQQSEELADKLSSTTEDYIKERNAATEAEIEREALRVELGEMALVLEQQTRTLTREHEQRERAEAALLRHVERDHTEALKIEAQREEDYKTHGPWCRCAGCMRLWPTSWKLPVRVALRDIAPSCPHGTLNGKP